MTNTMTTPKRVYLFIFLISASLDSARTNFDTDEDSGSIEIPNRPENRQETSQGTPKDDKTLLNLISKVMGSFQGSLQNRAKKIRKKSDLKYLVQKTKKALNSVNKAFVHVEKAKKSCSKPKTF